MTTYLGGQPEPSPERVSGYLHERRYHLRQKLGQGGMGAVYLAEDTRATPSPTWPAASMNGHNVKYMRVDRKGIAKR